jgi:hypothetical protein
MNEKNKGRAAKLAALPLIYHFPTHNSRLGYRVGTSVFFGNRIIYTFSIFDANYRKFAKTLLFAVLSLIPEILCGSIF